MLYLDTSILVTALTSEPRSRAVFDWLGGLDAQTAVSSWVFTEFTSAVSIKVRVGTSGPIDGQATRAKFDALVQRSFHNIAILDADFRRAADFAADYTLNLRGSDALHLAITKRSGATLCTLDKRQADVGRALNIETQLI